MEQSSTSQSTYIKGRNWGDINVGNNKIVFTGEEKSWFSIPITSISNVQQASNKKEIALEFNIEGEKDPEAFLLTEMRFFVPETEEDQEEKEKEPNSKNDESQEEEKKVNVKTRAEILKDEISRQANVGTVGDSIAHIPEIQMITPRGKFDLYFMKSVIKILGPTHNYKILHKTIKKIFLLPKTDGHHHFLIISLESPISQGNTSYPFLIFQMKDGAESTVNLNIPSDMKVDLPNPLKGNVMDNIAKLFNSIVNKGIIIPSKNFLFSKGPFLKCSFKANEGVLYPLEKSLLFVHKPVMYIEHGDIKHVDCARVHDTNLQQRTFDMNIITKKDEIQFVGLEKAELEHIVNYFSSKGVKINNIDEKNNTFDITPSMTTTKRQRAPVTDAPMELPSDESLIDDENYSSNGSNDMDVDDDDDEEEEEESKSEKKKKKDKKDKKINQ